MMKSTITEETPSATADKRARKQFDFRADLSKEAPAGKSFEREAADKSAHTPGPWKVRPWKVQSWRDADDPGNRIIDATGFEIAKLSFTGGSEDADARLIAAAPEQHQELGAIHDALEAGETVTIEPGSVKAKRIAAAIAKAEGKS